VKNKKISFIKQKNEKDSLGKTRYQKTSGLRSILRKNKFCDGASFVFFGYVVIWSGVFGYVVIWSGDHASFVFSGSDDGIYEESFYYGSSDMKKKIKNDILTQIISRPKEKANGFQD
jgi:hypothetical protein